MALLEVQGVSKRFGGVRAVNDVSFRVEKGMIKAVIGPNGAGKTTLFNMVSGFIAPDAGTIAFSGAALHGEPPHRVAARGVARTFQNIRLFAGMSALENVMVGRYLRAQAGFLAGLLGLGRARREDAAARGRALEVMEFLGIAHLADAEATHLAYGQQRAVELARALGITVLLVEHDMSLVMRICDEVLVLSYGEKIADADPPTVQRDPQVVRVYLGDEEC